MPIAATEAIAYVATALEVSESTAACIVKVAMAGSLIPAPIAADLTETPTKAKQP